MKAISRYDDIREISADPQRFCSGRGALVNDPIRDGLTIEGSLLHMDPPRHNAWRKVLNRAFTPRSVGQMEPRVRALAAELLDAIAPGEVVDLVDALTAPLPVLVICELLGVPDADRSDFRRWSDAAIVASDGRGSLSGDDLTSLTELFAFLTELAEAQGGAPRPTTSSRCSSTPKSTARSSAPPSW